MSDEATAPVQFHNRIERWGLVGVMLTFSALAALGLRASPTSGGKIVSFVLAASSLAFSARTTRRPRCEWTPDGSLIVHGTILTHRFSAADITDCAVGLGRIGMFERDVLQLTVASRGVVDLGQKGIWAKKRSRSATELRAFVNGRPRDRGWC